MVKHIILLLIFISCKREVIEVQAEPNNVVWLDYNGHSVFSASGIGYADQLEITDSLKQIFKGLDIVFTTDSLLIGKRVQHTIITKTIFGNGEYSGLVYNNIFAGSYPNFVFNRGEKPGIIACYISHENGHSLSLMHRTGINIMNADSVFIGARFYPNDLEQIKKVLDDGK